MKKKLQFSKFALTLVITALVGGFYLDRTPFDSEVDKTKEDIVLTVTDPDTSRDAEGDTFSIVAYDKTTGQVGGAGCSCVSISGGIDFLSDLITDGTTSPNNIVGAIHSQASYNATTQGWARDRMLAGDTPQQIIDFVVANDGGSASRQYGVVGVDVPGAAGWTGSSNGNFANDIQVDNALFTISVQGNILDTSNGPDILNDIRDGFLNTDGSLGDRLMAALQGAKRVGADNRCASRGNSGRTSFVQVLSPGETAPSLFLTTGNAVADGIEPIDELQCLYDDAILPATCRTTVNTFPYVMDFEDQVWIKDETNCGPASSTNSWIRSRFSTPTANTGPSSANQGNLYMFVEASQGTNDRAIIKSPCFDLPTGQNLQLSFDYHMFGANMGSLALTINDGTGWTTLWSASGSQGNAWQTQQVDLSAYQGSTVSFRFDGTTGNGVESDMAVDNVSIAEAGVIVCSNTVDTYPYNESFESSFGVWSQSSNDNLDWTRDSNGTPSNNTGPAGAIDGNVYIYVEASGNGTGYPNKRAIIESPCFDLTDKTSSNFSFSYHMFGANDMGSIDLEVSTNGGISWSSIWSLQGNQGNQWFSQSINLNAYLGQSAVQLRFNRVTGSTWQADIALDKFNLTATGGPDTTPPSAPSDLVANNTTESSTTLSWTSSIDNVGVTGYDIYEGTSVIGSATGTSFDVTGLSPSTSYAFTVVARDAAGNESTPSNTANVTTMNPPDTQAPSNPTNLAASTIAETSLTLNWNGSTDNVGVTGYEIFLDGGSIGTVATNTANVTGLVAGTSYSFQVRAFDAAGNNSGFSNTANATTTGGGGGGGCTNGVAVGYSESFETSIGVWTQSTADDINWTRDSNGTPSNNTGPSSGSPGSFYMYVEASGNGTGYPNKQAILNSPCIDLTGETEATFSFNYHMFGASDMGSIALEASTDGATWTSIWSATGNKGNQWNSESVSLDAYAGSSVQLRFNRVTGSTWKADIAIDGILVTAGGGGGGPAPTGYCASNGNNVNDEYIQRVQIGSINNATGASSGGYGDFTSLSTNLSNSNSITITPAWTGTIYPEAYAVFVDWNRDGDFNDAGELAYSRSATTATPITGSFNIPAGASAGATRMRVSMKYNGIPTACESFTYGEVEDYEVVIPSSFGANGTGVNGNNNTTSAGFSLYPNPVNRGVVNIKILDVAPKDYVIFNIVGQRVQSGAFNSRIDVSSLQSGMYIIEVNAEEGKKFLERFIKE